MRSRRQAWAARWRLARLQQRPTSIPTTRAAVRRQARYTGRMYITNSGGGIGVTFYSDFTNDNIYYRLRRHGTGGDASFHLNSHGATVEGTHDTGVIPTINTWYRFIVEVEGVGGTVHMRQVKQIGMAISARG